MVIDTLTLLIINLEWLGYSYTKEDVAGRVHVRSIIEKTQQIRVDYIASHQPGMISKTSSQQYMDTDDLLSNTLNAILRTPAGFRATV